MTTIRYAAGQDIPLIRDLAHAIWPDAYANILSKDQLEYMLELIYSQKALEQEMNEGHRFLIIETNGVPQGFASFSETDPGIFKLHKLYVLPSRQGAGLGRLLLEHILKVVGALEASALQLNVNRHNRARHFYEKSGFRVLREEDIFIGGGYYMNDYVMQYDLP
jgi:ribosomal protein S18 acetylase RimI-like enzyme